MASAATDTFMKAINTVHRTLFDVTNGKIGGKLGKMAALKLTTTGRKSGQPRTVMLTSPTTHDGAVVIIASKGGDDRHPEWYLNLQANPTVTIEMDGKTFTAETRTATSEEKTALWPDVVAAYKGYAGYQEKTDRDIPVVLCTPA